MVTHRQPVVSPSGAQVLHPSYELHAVAAHLNTQHAAMREAHWNQTLASHPYGHFSRPSTSVNPNQYRV